MEIHDVIKGTAWCKYRGNPAELFTGIIRRIFFEVTGVFFFPILYDSIQFIVHATIILLGPRKIKIIEFDRILRSFCVKNYAKNPPEEFPKDILKFMIG